MTSNSEQNKASGTMSSLMGSAKETLGNLTGSQSTAQDGSQQHAKGEAQKTGGQAQGYVQGATDSLTGKKDSVVGSLTGDKSQQASGEAQKTKGDAQQSWNS